jgi:hypothetical protein
VVCGGGGGGECHATPALVDQLDYYGNAILCINLIAVHSLSVFTCFCQVFEPIPYRSALKENCTHVLVLRTRADDISVTARLGGLEKMIIGRYFGRKAGLPDIAAWMNNQYHKLVYAEDMLVLNAANRDFDDSSSGPKIFTIALPKGAAIPFTSYLKLPTCTYTPPHTYILS